MLDESKFLNPQEIRELRRSLCDRSKSGKKRAVTRWLIVDLGLQTGLRASEMCDLLIEDIHIAYGQNSIYVKNGKGGKSANIIINESFKKHLKRYLKWLGNDSGPLLVTERGGKYSRQALHSIVKGIFKAHKLPERYNVHSLRHSFCSELYRNTQNLRLVQMQARHSNVQTTTIYANLLDEEVAQGMKGLYS
ncbi:MAG: site-specific integrase [Nitrosomonadaceae bacterium]